MPRFKIKSLFAFTFLALVIYNFRHAHGNALEYVIATLAAVIFWYLLGLKLALTSLRNILVLTLVLGMIVLVFRVSIPLAGPVSSVGLLQEFDLNPAQIGLLRDSHDTALEIHLQKPPRIEERYYKIADLSYAVDGLHYSNRPQKLNPLLMPETFMWAKANLTGQNIDGDTAKVRFWFVNSLAYSLSPGTLNSSTPLDQFLFERRQGFCEHFAAAFTTILRLKGYRSRIAFGYAGGTWNPIFKTLTFENADAHVWVEVFDPKLNGYRTIDPTSWVFPEVPLGRPIETGLLWNLLTGVVFIFFCGVFFVRRGAALDRFILKVSKFEKKHGLDSKGRTLSERVSQIASVDGALGEKMLGSLRVYLAMYRDDPAPAHLERALSRSLAAW